MSNIYNLFKFLEEKEGKKMPGKVRLLDPNYIFDPNDFIDQYGSMNLSNIKNVKSLPENLKIKGTLTLMNTGFTTLPKGLEVGRNLIIKYNNIKSLPENLVVGGDLDLSPINVDAIPDITSLPKGLKVGRSLILMNTKIEFIPDDVVVEDIMDISYTPLSNKYTMKELVGMYPKVSTIRSIQA